jgi:hypothetical protein
LRMAFCRRVGFCRRCRMCIRWSKGWCLPGFRGLGFFAGEGGSVDGAECAFAVRMPHFTPPLPPFSCIPFERVAATLKTETLTPQKIPFYVRSMPFEMVAATVCDPTCVFERDPLNPVTSLDQLWTQAVLLRCVF